MRNEAREYAVVANGATADRTGRRTQRTITAICPFCQAEVQIFVWSLCGGGKLCKCGAKFQSGSRCHKLVEVQSTGPGAP